MGAQKITSLQEHRSELRDQASRELLQLQLEQFKHDEFYHREIARLTIHHRLSHMVMHLAKYVGMVASADADGDKLDRAIVDSVIIGLSTANILNVKLSDVLVGRDESFPNLFSLAAHLAKSAGIEQFDRDWLLREMAVSVGQMAKGCESVDHLEAFPFREAITAGLIRVLTTLFIAMAVRGIDQPAAIRKRLLGVKQKSIFHGLE